MTISIITLTTLLLAAPAFADDEASHAKLMGKWQQSDGETKSIWGFQDSAGSVHVTNSEGTKTVAFDCNTMGKECAVDDAGRRSKVTMYYNGPKLVEVEIRGAQVVKRRFAVTGDGDTMDLETIPISPSGKSEIAHFKRLPATVAKQ